MPIKRFPRNEEEHQLFIKELKEITDPLPNDKREESESEGKEQDETTRIYLTFMKVRTLLKDIEYHHKSKYRKEDYEQINESIYPLYCGGGILFTLSLKKDKITFEIENVRSVTATVPDYTTTANGYPLNQWSNEK